MHSTPSESIPPSPIAVAGSPAASDFVEMLVRRDRLLRQIRNFFHHRGFLEVQPPCLARDCVVDAFLDPIGIPAAAVGIRTDSQNSPIEQFFLQTSPESAMKRLLCRGAPSIFALGPVFRRDEVGPRHNVEFTMLEWYEVGGDARSAVGLLGDLAVEVFQSDTYQTTPYAEAFQRYLGIHPTETPVHRIAEKVAEIDAGLAESLATDRDELLDVLLSHFIEPRLGESRPEILTRYPSTQAALARKCHDDTRFAERFELFYQGVELANGYDELLDTDELVERYEHNNRVRRRHGKEVLKTETTLVAAMRQGLPPCSGVAVGVDRLLMLQTGVSRISDVIPLMIDTA